MANPDRAREAMLGRGQRENYQSSGNLLKRQALFNFPDPSRSSGPPLIEHVEWTGSERVLDAGCGNGIWIRTISERFGVRSVVGLDLSFGMLEDAQATVGRDGALVEADISGLPFRDESFDVVLCLWMMYHVADHRRALEECRRVLRTGGHVLVTANDPDPGRPFEEVLGAALSTVTGLTRDRWLPVPNFSAANGAAVLGPVFGDVDQRRNVAAFAVPFAEPVIAAMESMRGPIEILLGHPVDWPEAERVARSLVDEVIAREGAFRTTTTSVSFLATK